MQNDIRLSSQNLAQYARHGITEINLTNLDSRSEESADGTYIDLMPLHTISLPKFFWKRGTYVQNTITENPRLYVASERVPKISLPRDALEVVRLGRPLSLQGFFLQTEDVGRDSCYWGVQALPSKHKPSRSL